MALYLDAQARGNKNGGPPFGEPPQIFEGR